MVTWDATADARLLTSILRVHKIQINPSLVAADFGQSVTAKAITRRLETIRSKAKAANSGVAAAGDGEKEKNTTPGIAKNCTPTPKKRKNQKVLEGGVVKMRSGSPSPGMKGKIGAGTGTAVNMREELEGVKVEIV